MSNLKTLCRDCVFRINDQNGKQSGCEIGRLSKFIDRQEAELIGDYYQINRFCNTCSNQKIDKEKILEEFRINISLIVDGTSQEYWRILKLILNQTMKPQKVFVVFKDIFDKDKYNEFQSIYTNEDINLVFKKYFENKPFVNMVDDIVNKCKTSFYIPVINNLDENLIKNYNKKINEDMLQINAELYPNYYNSLVNVYFHKIAGGNEKELLINKCKSVLSSGSLSQKEKDTIIIHE